MTHSPISTSSMPPQVHAGIWQLLLDLRRALSAFTGEVQYCILIPGKKPEVFINAMPSSGNTEDWICVQAHDNEMSLPDAVACFSLVNKYAVNVIHAGSLTHEECGFFEQYLAYCFLPVWARKLKRAIAVSHFAQSLDGKIATCAGDSKWIGNPENLLHAHRMRALCEGILIGSGTLERDRPSLTVRLVPGDNPRRIVVGASANDFTSLLRSCEDRIWVLGTHNKVENAKGVRHINFEPSGGKISGLEILRFLYKQGLSSVYIEGGAATTSNFLHDGAIDVLQLHLSPQIFGSGISGIELPLIDQVRDAVTFPEFCFQKVGDTIMFVGEPKTHTSND